MHNTTHTYLMYKYHDKLTLGDIFAKKTSLLRTFQLALRRDLHLSNRSSCPYCTNSLGVTKTSTAVTSNIYRNGHNQWFG